MSAVTGPAATAEGPGQDFPAGFDDLPANMIVRAFGVEYAHVRPREGGDLYVTRLGWPHVAALLPSRWYTDHWFAQQGVRLPGSTGHVYHVRPRPGPGGSPELVVKVSRVAQDVPVVIEASFPETFTAAQLAEVRFNSPMEEFGLVMELRRSGLGEPGLRVLTQRPLAIFTPPEESDLWELGRSTSSFLSHRLMLAEDQEGAVKAIELDIRRTYVLLYGWVGGRDAEQYFDSGKLSEEQLHALTPRVIREMAGKGFVVVDSKPKHFILRMRKGDGGLLRRHGELAYALVDYELLQRTPEHQQRFKAARQQRYWELRAHAPQVLPPLSQLRLVNIFGVDYTFGAAPEGGQLWVVGREAGLFDYFLPDRWRRSRRVKMSSTSEVYRTRTRDNVDIVYRMSRVGFRPRVDPLEPAGRRIREAGYNSPFEEVAIAEHLREMGISTVHPRAIYRTAHETMKALRLRDSSRFADHAGLVTPEDPAAPVLSPDFDYYTIWDTYRGREAPPDGESGTARAQIGLDQACAEGLVTDVEAERAMEAVGRRLSHTTLPVDAIAGDEFVVRLDPKGAPVRRDDCVELVLSVDALTAYEYGLIDEPGYRALIARMDERLRAVDCEMLDITGRHLLLTVGPDGKLELDAAGEIHITLCNFTLIHGLYRPIR